MAADGARVGRPRRGPRRGPSRGRPWPAPVVGAVLGAVLLAGCTGDDPERTGSGTGDTVALEMRIASCAGRADEATRSTLESGIGDALSSYVVSGFLGDYPREDFVRSFAVFTSGAAEKAAGDIDVLTAAAYKKAERVRATRLRARVSCLAPGGKVTGATAHVEFDFEAELPGRSPTDFTLSGRFLMTPGASGWSVFGYDVSRDDLAAREAPS